MEWPPSRPRKECAASQVRTSQYAELLVVRLLVRRIILKNFREKVEMNRNEKGKKQRKLQL